MEFSSREVKRLLKNKKSKKSLIGIREQFLPDEIEILSWLPVESLLRFKCVSKQMYSLIQDRRFIMKHLIQSKRTKPVPYLFQIHPNTGEMHGENFKFISFSRGLVLEMNDASKKYRIRNPSTRQILDLPAPLTSRHQLKLFNVPNTIDFKVVSMSRNEDYEIQMLTVGTDEQWRPLKLSSMSNLGKMKHIKSWVGIGFVHCIRLIADGSNLCIRVDSLDKGSECFSTSALHQGFFSDLNKVLIMSWYGYLSFAVIVGENLNVMVLENCKGQKWSERKIIVPLKFLKEDQGMKENPVQFKPRFNNLWFWNNDQEVLSYNIKLVKITYLETRVRDGFTPYRWQYY